MYVSKSENNNSFFRFSDFACLLTGAAILATGVALSILNNFGQGSLFVPGIVTISLGGGVLALSGIILSIRACSECLNDVPVKTTSKIQADITAKEYFEKNGIFNLPDELIEALEDLRERLKNNELEAYNYHGFYLYGPEMQTDYDVTGKIGALLDAKVVNSDYLLIRNFTKSHDFTVICISDFETLSNKEIIVSKNEIILGRSDQSNESLCTQYKLQSFKIEPPNDEQRAYMFRYYFGEDLDEFETRFTKATKNKSNGEIVSALQNMRRGVGNQGLNEEIFSTHFDDELL